MNAWFSAEGVTWDIWRQCQKLGQHRGSRYWVVCFGDYTRASSAASGLHELRSTMPAHHNGVNLLKQWNKISPFSLKLFPPGIYSQKQEMPIQPGFITHIHSLGISFMCIVHVGHVYHSLSPAPPLIPTPITWSAQLHDLFLFSFLAPLNLVSAACVYMGIWAISWSMASKKVPIPEENWLPLPQQLLYYLKQRLL